MTIKQVTQVSDQEGVTYKMPSNTTTPNAESKSDPVPPPVNQEEWDDARLDYEIACYIESWRPEENELPDTAEYSMINYHLEKIGEEK